MANNATMLQPATIVEPTTFIKEIFVDSDVSITTTNNQRSPKKCLSYGHIASIIFDFTLAITETTATQSAVPAQNAINSFAIKDKNGKEIFKCNGNQISRMRKLATTLNELGRAEYRKGEYDAGTNIGATGGNYRVEIPIQIPAEYQPLTIEYTLGVLADFHSVVGDAVATGTLRLSGKFYVQSLDERQREIAKLCRFQAYNLDTITVEKSFQSQLDTGRMIHAIAVDMTADANLTDLTFKAGGEVGLDKTLERVIAAIENRAFDDGHTPAGFYVLPIPETVVTDGTEFRINPGASVTPVLYLSYSLPNEKR